MDKHPPQLTVVFDVDLAALLCVRGVPIQRVTDEAGRIGLWFPAGAVLLAQEELAAGKAKVEVRAWSSTIRRLHADYFSPAAKAALRSRSDGEVNHVTAST